jgi:hypothetical protein
VAEFEAHGTDDDRRCLEYVLRGTAGSDPTLWPHAGGRRMDAFSMDDADDGRGGQPFSHFVAHPNAVRATLLEEHVLALRLYTTAAYKSLNDPLRMRGRADSTDAGAQRGAPHPFPVTVAYLADGIKRLRATGAHEGGVVSRCDFWRGLRNLELPASFRADGGTELACCSTSADISVALSYSDKAEKRLLIKVVTRGFIDRGADLRFLSAFPEEVEYLYPPLTYLMPTGREDTILARGVEYTVIEVEPRFPS